MERTRKHFKQIRSNPTTMRLMRCLRLVTISQIDIQIRLGQIRLFYYAQ